MQTVIAAGESGSPDTLSTIVPNCEYSASQLQKDQPGNVTQF